jgi:hypothetical protein
MQNYTGYILSDLIQCLSYDLLCLKHDYLSIITFTLTHLNLDL